MAVHAHPDDESSSTGGILARYSDEGIRTVVVTCTNGEFGDGPGGIKPGADGHDPDDVARIRRDELERATEILGVTHLEMLGYHDSGMPDWEYKDRADVFCNVPLEESEARITTEVDVTAYVDQKREALATHASQIAESWFGKLPSEAYRTMFGTETFIRAHDTTGAAVPEDDLFAGLR